MKRLIIFLCLINQLSFGQNNGQMTSDSLSVLSFDLFYDLVINNHPIVKQANLLTDQAAQEVRLARGSFDPKLEGNWKAKDFKDTEYYNLLDVSLKIPTWFPIDPKVGFQQNSGTYLNPENYISDATDNRQLYAGVSVPIGQGLFIDSRRATVRQANLMQEMADADKVKAINKILLSATKDYWEWCYAYNNYILMQQSIDLAQNIFDRTKMAFDYGEVAPIDTVQAKINLLGRQTAFQQANMERIKAALTLSNHLWTADVAPLELTESVIPDVTITREFNAAELLMLLEMAEENHPELRKLALKNQSLIIDRNLARENLKPRLDLNYYFLDQPFDYQGNSNDVLIGDNYKVGIDFSLPIFLRKERGKLGLTKLKLTENSYQQDFAQRQILNDINAQYNSVVVTRNILAQQRQMAENYQLILSAEQLNLENGESDLFKLNIQLDKFIESKSKVIKLEAEYQKSIATLYWAAGISNLGLVE